MELIWLTVIFLGLVCALLCSNIANSKGWEGSSWGITGFLLGPLALLAVVGLPDKKLRRYLRAIAIKLDAEIVEVEIEKEQHIDDYQKIISLLSPKLSELAKENYSEVWATKAILRDEKNRIIAKAKSIFDGGTTKWVITYEKEL